MLEAPLTVAVTADDSTDLRRHGRLSAAELDALHRRVRAEIVRPLARALIGDARGADRDALHSA